MNWNEIEVFLIFTFVSDGNCFVSSQIAEAVSVVFTREMAMTDEKNRNRFANWVNYDSSCSANRKWTWTSLNRSRLFYRLKTVWQIRLINDKRIKFLRKAIAQLFLVDLTWLEWICFVTKSPHRLRRRFEVVRWILILWHNYAPGI